MESINWACITLIPKIDTLEPPGDFRPISLINSTQKIFSKILAMRLNTVIDALVDVTQSAYIKG